LGANTVDLSGLTYGNGTFVAVGSTRVGPAFVTTSILTSTDATTWTSRTAGILDQIYYGVTFGGGTFVAVGLRNPALRTSAIAVSSNGVAWTRPDFVTSGTLFGVAYGNGLFVTVGSDTVTATNQPSGRIATSTDGAIWTDRSSSTTPPLSAVAFGDGRFVAVGGTNVVTSIDGITWRSWGSATASNAITYGNGVFVDAGSRGTIQTSANGDTWTSRSTGTTHALFGIAYGKGRFVAVGNFGVILASDDGIAWTNMDSGFTNSILYAVTYGAGTFVAVGYPSLDTGFSTVLTSPDGFAWTSRTPVSVQTLRGAAYGNGTFVVVGDQGTILQSDLATELSLAVGRRLGAAGFELLVLGTPGSRSTLQMSTNLNTSRWIDQVTFTNSETPFSLTIATPATIPQQFYRAVSP
jgi:hypothetical protein